MEEQLAEFFSELHWAWVGLIVVGSIAVLGKGADWLVEEAVVLSERSGIPKVVIGATIVSLGTTTPEAAVSVFSALEGEPGLALGNAVGSIICDTGLVLGVACLIRPLGLDRQAVDRQSWLQVTAGLLLIAVAWPWSSPLSAFETGGNVAQWIGFAFLVILAWYFWDVVRWAQKGKGTMSTEEVEEAKTASTPFVVAKLLGGLILVVVSAKILIPAVMEVAGRVGVPEGVIAATLVAFGTSLPELVTACTAARRGHGELAVGNVVGADILNVLFVVGLSAAVTPAGLKAGSEFFVLYFPSMMVLLIVLRVAISASGDSLKRSFGVVVLVIYVVVTALGYLVK